MSKKNKLIPELRFPEFRNEGEWNYDKIDNLFHLQDGYAFSSNAFTDSKLNTKQVIRITDINNQNKNGDKVFVSEENAKALAIEKYRVKKGDLLLSLTGAAGFNFFIWKSDDAYINQRTMKLNSKKKENDSLKVILEPLVHSKINEIGTGQNNNLSKDALKEIEFPFPNPKEQVKIASCLSSLDDLIEAHSQKLDLLKDHKKGLMQNLFPQEGEKVPKVRFKEFEKDGEWVEKTLGECLKQKPEYGINAPAVPYSDELPTYLRITDISVNGIFLSDDRVSVNRDVSENNYLSEGDIVFARTGASVGKSYKYRKKDGELVFAGFLIRVKPNLKKINSEFLFQFLSTSQYWKWVSFISARSGQPGINGTEYSSMPISLPPTIKEQQKIASCLSALDDLITAQADKVEQLKQHKKGLMQGLFPKMID